MAAAGVVAGAAAGAAGRDSEKGGEVAAVEEVLPNPQPSTLNHRLNPKI